MANYPTYNPAIFAKQKNGSKFVDSASMVPFEPDRLSSPLVSLTAIGKALLHRPAHI